MYCGLWGYLQVTQRDASTDVSPTSRVLGIWIIPGITALHVRFGTDVDWNEGFDQTSALPLDEATVFTIQTGGKIVRVSYNGQIVAGMMLKGTRLSGPAHLYASSTLPGYEAPNALFGKYDIQPLVGGL
jgi:hypothetical protein